MRALLLLLTTATVVVLSFGLQAAKPAHAAATFTVNSTGDAGDADTTDNICDSDAGTADEQCTLRAAIQQANGTAGPDAIDFNVSGTGCNASGVCTISLSSALPPITEQVTIDGYSQTGASPATDTSNAVLKIELDGTNAFNGLRIQAANSTVKGLIINRFDNVSVWLQGSGATGNKVEGNFIGTDAAGTVTDPDGIPNNGDELGNLYGVYIEGSNNTVGGTGAAARNIISGNAIGVSIFLSGATGNQVMGNYIGTKANGAEALGNNLGVLINGASNNTIGGTVAGARNVISGSIASPTFGQDGDGVYITSPGTTGNKVEGNYIGTDASGTQPLGNAGNGVRIDNSPSNNTVGGTVAGARNIISGNSGDGVAISDDAAGNRILSNSIFDNGELGIDLVGGDETTFGFGVTKNDPKDPDKGANMRQNFPVLSSATLSGGQITLSGLLNSRPRKTFTIQFFSSPAADADPSGFGEGKTFLREIPVKTNRKGKRSFSTTFTPAQPVSAGEKITATATNNLTGDTSEFSAACSVGSTTCPP